MSLQFCSVITNRSWLLPALLSLADETELLLLSTKPSILSFWVLIITDCFLTLVYNFLISPSFISLSFNSSYISFFYVWSTYGSGDFCLAGLSAYESLLYLSTCSCNVLISFSLWILSVSNSSISDLCCLSRPFKSLTIYFWTLTSLLLPVTRFGSSCWLLTGEKSQNKILCWSGLVLMAGLLMYFFSLTVKLPTYKSIICFLPSLLWTLPFDLMDLNYCFRTLLML